ncbi:MAG: hypothetical protein RL885_32765 [Planctomycetota bacterium]
MHTLSFGLWILCVLNGPSSDEPLRLDIYPSGLVLVEETRTVELPAGRTEIRIDLVRSGADVSTLEVLPLDHPGGVRVLAMVRRNDLPAATFVEIEADAAGPERLRLRFQARGLSSSIRYVGTVDVEGKTLDLVQELEVNNASGERFEGVAIRSIIGDVKTVPSTIVRHGRAPDPAEGAPAGLPPEPLVQDFAEHTAIDFGSDVTLQSGVTTRRRTHAVTKAPIDVVYRYDVSAGPKVRRVLEARNGADSPLGGATLQPGSLLLYEREPGGGTRFSSRGSFPNVPAGGRLELPVGIAEELVVEREPMSLVRTNLVQGEYNRALVSYDQEESFRFEIRNHANAARTLIVRELVTGSDRFELLESSVPGERKDQSSLEFRVEVPASGATELTYRVKKVGVKP